MEFLILILWLTLSGTALVVGPAIVSAPASALAAGAALGGTAVTILFIVLDAPGWAVWASVGFSALGLVGAGWAAAQLTGSEHVTGTALEVNAAGAVGLQLPFYGAVLFCSLVLAAGGVDPVV